MSSGAKLFVSKDCWVRGKIVGADATRSLACLAVLAFHLGQVVSGAKWPPPIAACLRLTEYGKFGVCVFFVLSGFLLAKPFWLSLNECAQLPSLRNYFLRRAARILPATWVCMVVSYFVAEWFLYPARTGYEGLRLAAGLTFLSDWSWITLFPVDVNGPLWSLSFEVSSYLLLVLGFVAIARIVGGKESNWRGPAMWLLIIASSIVAHAAATIVFKHGPEMTGFQYGTLGGARSWFPQYNAFGFFCIFAIGTFAAGVSNIRLSIAARHWPFQFLWLAFGFGAVSILTTCLSLLHFSKPPFGFPALPFIVATFLIVAPFLPGRRIFENKAFTFVANISFGIYVWHDLFIFVFERALPQTMEAHERSYLICALTVAATFTVSYLSFRFFERRIMDWAHSVRFGNPTEIPGKEINAKVAVH